MERSRGPDKINRKMVTGHLEDIYSDTIVPGSQRDTGWPFACAWQP